MADATGGTVRIVDAAMWERQMQLLLSEQFLATQVEVTLLAENALFWQLDEHLKQTKTSSAPRPTDDLQQQQGERGMHVDGGSNRLCKMIGNVTANTTIAFRFAVRANSHLNEHDKLHFQVCSNARQSTSTFLITLTFSFFL